jgi:DNA-binding beta-propeller fold protein YncE
VSPSPTTAPSDATPSGSPIGSPGPEPTTIGAFPARRLYLGSDAAPIHVFSAFDAIWVANIHANDVRRYDPDTMAEVARIPVDSAAWFAATDDALWVTSQTGAGVSRIDPATNTVVAHVGDVPPCAAPVVALDSVWQAACDGNAILRIDPRTNELLRSFPLNGRAFLVFAGGRLMTVGQEGLEAVNPETGAFTKVGGGRPPDQIGMIASDGETVWEVNIGGLVRLDPATGRTIASFPYPTAHGVSFSGDHAWVTVGGLAVIEIDLATNAERRRIPLDVTAPLPVEANGALWVADFDTSTLWKVDLGT